MERISSEAAAGWQRSGAARAQILAPLTDRMLDLAGVDIGHRVLDVAAGTGEQTLLAAQRVGPTGMLLRHEGIPNPHLYAVYRCKYCGSWARFDQLLRGMPQSLPSAAHVGMASKDEAHDNPHDLRCLRRAARRATQNCLNGYRQADYRNRQRANPA